MKNTGTFLSMALLAQSFFGPPKHGPGIAVKGFKGWPGNARARGWAKRRAKLRALREAV